MLNETDVWLGAIRGCNFYMSQDQFEYWKHTQLTVDVVPGRGASFSLEIPMGIRFVIKSCLFSEDFLKLSERSESILQSPLFKLGGTPILERV